MNERQIVNKIIQTYVEVNKHEDYTDYKGLITALINWKNEQLTLTDVVKSFICDAEEKGGSRCGTQCLGCDGFQRMDEACIVLK